MSNWVTDRCLGHDGPPIGPVGVGTWAIGGPFYSGADWLLPVGSPLGYGQADDRESIRALHCAIDHGAKLIDTADAYGTGHAEQVIGEAIKHRRDDVIIATKFGNTINPDTSELTGIDVSPAYIRSACEASLQRLQVDYIDLYQLHLGDLPLDQVGEVVDTLERLCDDGLVRYHGWSTDDPERAALFATQDRGAAAQFDMNVFNDAPDMLAVCDSHKVAGLLRVPLAMGFLSGKYGSQSELPGDDIRSNPPDWLKYFDQGGRAAEHWRQQLESIREILSSNGRSLVQGALAWLWARSDRVVPIPGMRTAAQAKENLSAIEFGPLSPAQMLEIEQILGR